MLRHYKIQADDQFSCSGLYRIVQVIAIVILGCVAFASLFISLWNTLNEHSPRRSKYVRIQYDLNQLNRRLVQLHDSVDNDIGGLERTIEMYTLDISELERRLLMATNDNITKFERRMVQFQESSSSELERRIQMSTNDSISELEQRVIQVQNLTMNKISELDGFNISELEGRIQRSINDNKPELQRLVQIDNDTVSELQRTVETQNNKIELQRNTQKSLEIFVNASYEYLRLSYFRFPIDSCTVLFQINPRAPSGYYWIVPQNGHPVRVYCDFTRQCGCAEPNAWTRLALLNMSDPNHVCPSNWTTISSPVRTCGRGWNSSSGCNSVFYTIKGLSYRRVCGRVIAYQHGITNAFYSTIFGTGINGPYIDGISFTHGRDGDRRHIWSFASASGGIGPSETLCECSNRDRWIHWTEFAAHHYYCDSGNHSPSLSSTTFYSDDPLWDGRGCSPFSTCCNGPPWFCRNIPGSFDDYIEVRICKSRHNGDTPIQLLEIYVQ